MGIKSLVKGTLGYLGKRISNNLDAATGGLSSHIGKKVLDFSHKHSGTIGKIAGNIGRHVLTDKARNVLSNATDTALKYVPDGKIKDTISNISKAAKNNTSVVDLGKSPSNKVNSPNSTVSTGKTTYGQYTKPRIKSAAATIF